MDEKLKKELEKTIKESNNPYIRRMSINQYTKYKEREKIYNKKYYNKKIKKLKIEEKKTIISFD